MTLEFCICFFPNVINKVGFRQGAKKHKLSNAGLKLTKLQSIFPEVKWKLLRLEQKTSARSPLHARGGRREGRTGENVGGGSAGSS